MKKVIGIFIITLLIGTVIPVIGTNLNEVDVPVWEVGDSWTYTCTFYGGTPDDSMYFDFSCDLTFEVLEITDELFILAGTSSSLSGIFNLMGLDLKFTRFTSYNADLHIRKSDLGITYHGYTIDGIALPKIGSVPLPIPIIVTLTMESEFDPVFLISPFPLFEGKEGSNFNTMVNQDAKLSLFRIITLADLQDDIFPLGPYHYECNEDQVTVEAGTFDVINISFMGGGDDDYFNYASEVGNFVKLRSIITHGGTEKTAIDFSLELKSTNYN